MREKVYQSRIEDVERIKGAWEELYQGIIGAAVRQWRTRLHVKAKSDHFEHKLPWLNDEMPDIFNHSILTVGFYYDFRISDQMRR